MWVWDKSSQISRIFRESTNMKRLGISFNISRRALFWMSFIAKRRFRQYSSFISSRVKYKVHISDVFNATWSFTEGIINGYSLYGHYTGERYRLLARIWLLSARHVGYVQTSISYYHTTMAEIPSSWSVAVMPKLACWAYVLLWNI